MTPAEATRPVLIALACAGGLAMAGCGAVDSSPHRFGAMADSVAEIDVPLHADGTAATGRTAQAAGLRPVRFTPVKVTVMDPHAMWDARDVQAGLRRESPDEGLRGAVIRAAHSEAEAAAPRIAQAALQKAVARVSADAKQRSETPGRSIQLGAYSSRGGAQQAWDRISGKPGLAGLTPAFEPVQVNGRTLTRLKVGPISSEAAAALCQSADVADPWCVRNR